MFRTSSVLTATNLPLTSLLHVVDRTATPPAYECVRRPQPLHFVTSNPHGRSRQIGARAAVNSVTPCGTRVPDRG